MLRSWRLVLHFGADADADGGGVAVGGGVVDDAAGGGGGSSAEETPAANRFILYSISNPVFVRSFYFFLQ